MIRYDTTPHYWINHLGFLIRKDLVRAFMAEGHDFSAEEWAILLVLGAHPGMTATELAAQTLRDKTTVTRMVDKLVGKGLVRRDADARDRRVVRLHLETAGNEVFAQLAGIARGLIDRTLADIAPEDIDTTIKTLSRMAQNLKKDGKDGV